MLIFSEHDLIKNPPFSKLDLISCRNLLIYMGAELQKKLMPVFHYALNAGGILVLGAARRATTNFRCKRLPNGPSWRTTLRLVRWSVNAETSSTFWAAPAGTW